ncbi:MAG: hypothetical protein P8M72_04210 [Gammaproteobacteria bacterium]|nr:hypothetical protein [Gammaproteobacteria bacterium]
MTVLLKYFVARLVVFFLLIFSLTACHPWFRMGPGAPADQVPVITSPDGAQYQPGTPSWVALIDQCMGNGGLRNDCIENLPAEEKSRFDVWEQNQAINRSRLLEIRRQQQQ